MFRGLRVAKTSLKVLPPAAEFWRVRLAHHDAALALDTLHKRVRFFRHVIGEAPRAVGGANARDIGEDP